MLFLLSLRPDMTTLVDWRKTPTYLLTIKPAIPTYSKLSTREPLTVLSISVLREIGMIRANFYVIPRTP